MSSKIVVPGGASGVVAVKHFGARVPCTIAGGSNLLFAAFCCALLMLQSVTAGMYIKDTPTNEDDLQQRHLLLRQQQQQPFFALPLDAFEANPTTVVGLKPFVEHLMFEKRFAPREMGKRERIIMDAMGGNDYLIKRSFGRK